MLSLCVHDRWRQLPQREPSARARKVWSREHQDSRPGLGRTGPLAIDPDPQRPARPERRYFEPGFKLRVLEEWDRASSSTERAALRRREGIYSS